jgi:hypothetical protein
MQKPFKRDFDYEEDDYDRYKSLNKSNSKNQGFTNKVTFKKIEFDYEEDPYDPEQGR